MDTTPTMRLLKVFISFLNHESKSVADLGCCGKICHKILEADCRDLVWFWESASVYPSRSLTSTLWDNDLIDTIAVISPCSLLTKLLNPDFCFHKKAWTGLYKCSAAVLSQILNAESENGICMKSLHVIELSHQPASLDGWMKLFLIQHPELRRCAYQSYHSPHHSGPGS